MKFSTLSLAALSLAFLAGCASNGHNYVADALPTAESVVAAGGSQLYKGTKFFPSDFNADGSLRTLAQYDLTKESAPCTALGDFYRKDHTKALGQFFRGEVNGKPVQFNCRAVSGESTDTRLFLIGSSYDCQNRDGFSSSVYVGKAAHDFDKACSAFRVSGGGETAVDRAYKGRS